MSSSSQSASSSYSEKMACLICKSRIPKNAMINHIADHISYNKHRCSRCSFRSVFMEAMMDHQCHTGHKVELDAKKNWYVERLCQLAYLDFDYAEKRGEETIRGWGTRYADKERLLDLLKAEEIKQEEQEEIVHIETDTDQIEPTAEFIGRNIQQLDQEPGTSEAAKARTQRMRRDQQMEVPASVEIQQMMTSFRDSMARRASSPRKKTQVQRAAADSSNADLHSDLNVSMERQLEDFSRLIKRGVEKRKCKMCTLFVNNDYPSQKQHAIDYHMANIPVQKRQIHIIYLPVLERCFKQDGQLFITNDLQCNICGRECKTKAERYKHVSSVHTDYQLDCLFSCGYKASSFQHFVSHMNNSHSKKSYELEKEMKDRYVRFRAEFELKLTPLVRKCFPFDSVYKGKNLNEDAMLDEVECNFMPTRKIPIVLTQQLPVETGSSDSSDEEEIKQEETDRKESTQQPKLFCVNKIVPLKNRANKPTIRKPATFARQTRQRRQNRIGPASAVNRQRKFHP